ncbi:MAG: ligase-associated DNA damage response endonuclease PdeM [Betaproteobacteria bacterium]|nr:ligase-associated DNA damage response endonuclease PdeM [Betaproteobacteria bacterium]
MSPDAPDAGPGAVPPGAASVTVAGEGLVLLPERAVHWAAAATALVADVHFGKAASFRARGVPVPGGTTRENLERLDRVIATTACRRLVVLGDFLHGRIAPESSAMACLHAWRERHAALDVLLVRGNHDRHAGDPPPGLHIEAVAEPYVSRPFVLRHEPGTSEDGYVLSGHVHPAVRLSGRARERLRVPCFCFDALTGILPAFGAFTGTAVVAPRRGTRIFVAAGDRVVALPPES